MSNPTDLSDFTLKQLFHLYQLSEAEQSGASTSKDLNSELLSDQDLDLFSKIMAKKPDESMPGDKKVAGAEKNNHLSEIFDSLIDDIDSDL